MSAALQLKQKIYQLSSSDLVQLLDKYYSHNFQVFSTSTAQKAYKCFECCILVNDQKHCAGFGRNEEEAVLNAGRIALESIIDSGDLTGLSRVLEPEESELQRLLGKLEISEGSEHLKKEKISVEALANMDLSTLNKLVPRPQAQKIFDHFHPNTDDSASLLIRNEVTCK